MSDVWTWRLLDADGAVVAGEAQEFGSQDDAESWLGTSYEDLADRGVAAVTLLNGDSEVYGPMSLDPA